MKVQGKLEVAQLEWFTLAARPAASSFPYRIIFVTDLAQAQISDGTSWITIGANASGGAAGIDLFKQKLDQEKFGQAPDSVLDYAIGNSGYITPEDQNFTFTLLKQYTSGDSSIEFVVNALALNDSDKNIDATTNFTTTGAGASLTTSATAQVGSASIAFDKNGTATEAAVRYDRGSQNLSLSSNYRMWFYINMPTVTGVANIVVRVYADTTSNYRTYTKTVQFDGSTALATGWNLMLFDLSDTTGSTTGGTGWTVDSLSRYVEIGVTTTLAATTLTSIKLDSIYFSYYQPEILRTIGSEFTLYNTSTKDNIVIATSNSRSDGRLTLDATIANTYVGGLSVTARGIIERSTASTGAGATVFNDDSNFGGAITTAQELRLGTVLRESVNKNYTVSVEMIPTQRYAVTVVGGSTIGVSDPADDSANLANGDTIEIFRPQKMDGKTTYVLVASRALTAGSSASGGTTTLTVSPTDIAVGDIVCKRNLTSTSLSVVASGTKETYSALTLDAAPNGVMLKQGFLYPNPTSIWAHFTLGDVSSAEAIRNRKGTGSGLTITGTLNTGNSFLAGRYSSSGYSSGNLMSIADAIAQEIQGNDEMVQLSFWVYLEGFTGTARWILSKDNSGGNGWYIKAAAGSNVITYGRDSNDRFSSSAFTANAWNHIVLIINNSGVSSMYLNGTLQAGTEAAVPTTTSAVFRIGTSGTADFLTSAKLADLIIWRNGSVLSASQVGYLYNRGSYIDTIRQEILEYRYTAASQSGQKLSGKVAIARTTTAAKPQIRKVAIIGA